MTRHSTRRRAAAIQRAQYILPDVRFDVGLPREPRAYWRARDLWDLRVSLECYSAVFDRAWRNVGVTNGQ